jgi:peptidoglycan/LPS O-acetylase OafA/YrhL
MAFPTRAQAARTDTGEPTDRRAEIPSLDGLRAISIVLVLAGHAIKAGPHSFGFRALFLHADLGVRVFFIVSGFLITSLLLNERSKSGSISLQMFYIRRALRILPAFFLFVGCVALLSTFRLILIPAWFWLYVLTYTVNFAQWSPWVLNHLWSLSVEEQFYILWPLVMKIARPGTWAAVAVLAISANPAAHALHRFIGVHLAFYAFPFVCGPIAMGCLLAMRARQVRRVIVSSKVLSDGWILLFTLLLIDLLDAIPNDWGAPAVFLGIVTNSLLTLCVARLVFIPTGVASRVLNSAPVALIGKLSYSLYLWQQIFLNPNWSAPISIPFPVNLIATLAAASACYWGLEVRFLKLRTKFRKLAATCGVCPVLPQ